MIRIVTFLFLIPIVYGQKSKMEWGIVLENDSFTSTYYDQYYTNGSVLFFNYVSTPKKKEVQRINGLEIGQHIFNPKNVKSDNKDNHNRPFAGYLFVTFHQTRYFPLSIWKTIYQVGVVGPASQADDFQKWMHERFNFGTISGWQYQIQNTLALQYTTHYIQTILEENNLISFYWGNTLTLGTIYTNVGSSLLVQMKLTKNSPRLIESNYFDGLQMRDNSPFALFFLVAPKMSLHAYDATIQGALYNNSSEVTFPIQPIRFTIDAGLYAQFKDWNFAYEFHYTTNQVSKSNTTGFFYGSVKSSYRF